MELFIIVTAVFAIVIFIMSIGALFAGKCIKGSCGGEAIRDNDDELLNCETCPVRQRGECDSDPA